jgi:tetratricopeptide (TPR) repeat protein
MNQMPTQTSLLRRQARGAFPRLLVLGLFVSGAGLGASNAFAQSQCEIWWAEFVSVEGQVELATTDSGPWTQIKLGDRACAGDTIRVGRFGHALIVLPDESKVRIDQNSQLRLAEAESEQAKNWVDLIRGIILIISRDPRELNFSTPYVNAGLEGTEFVLEVDQQRSSVTALEGIVSLESAGHRIEVLPGERGSAGPSGSLQSRSVVDPFESVRWTPYSALILLGPLPSAESTADANANAEFYVGRAASRLSRGALSEAEDDLDLALLRDPVHPGVNALRAMIALARGQKSAAAGYADAAVELSAVYAPAWLAKSYVAQASFDYPSALEYAVRANGIAPGNAVIETRLAEAFSCDGRI